MRQARFWFVVAIVCATYLGPAAMAADRTEWVDENKDGRKETQIFYHDNVIQRTETDTNGDGKPDVFTDFKNGKPFKSQSDTDYDGKIDIWYLFDSEGHLKSSAKDTNKDGKPDLFSYFLKGRNLVLRESDRNYDGRIDRRWLTVWDPNKRLPAGMVNNRLEYISVPGYKTLWAEEDNDYDGTIDKVFEPGNPKPSQARIGQSIDTPRRT